jgi:hypothetical protein
LRADRAAVGAATVAMLAAGCMSTAGSGGSHGHSASPAAATSGPALTGFGATVAQWKGAHKLDATVPAENAYLPRLPGPDGTDTWQVVTVVSGRVISYTLNVRPTSLAAAEARARQELPPDTRVLWSHTWGDNCSQEQFQSATLAAAMGDGQVNVEFINGETGNARPVDEALFSTWHAKSVAQAPKC